MVEVYKQQRELDVTFLVIDLALEHLNRRLKTGSSKYISRSSTPMLLNTRMIADSQTLAPIFRCFEESLNVHQTAASHDIPSDSRDFKVILETLLEKEVFADKGRRSHSQ